MTPNIFYQTKVDQLTILVDKLGRRGNLVSTLRLLVATLAILDIVYAFKLNEAWLWIGLCAFIILLLFLIKYSAEIKKKRNYNKELLEINKNEIKALSRDFQYFESGEDFCNPNHPFSYDLDIFGEGSLFQLLNRTRTLQGRQQLYEMLSNLETRSEIISSRQNAIHELKDKIGWRQMFQTIGQLTPESPNDKERIESWLNIESKFYGNRFFSIVIWVLPVLTLASWGLSALGIMPYMVPIMFSFAQFLLTVANIRHVNLHHGLAHRSIKTLEKFSQLIKVTEDEEFKSEELRSIKNRTFVNTIKPSVSFKKLIGFVNGLDNRMNSLLAFVLNCVLLSDINYVYRIEKWSKEFRDVFPFWINAIGRFDAFSSLACFMYNNPNYTTPQISESGEFVLRMIEGGHPLLHEDVLVTNDLIQDGEMNLFLITGANMAGKSTFLRMVGLNLVLAMSGTSVCAKRFLFPPIQLYTSMRTNDSLQRQTSFFFAELKRLKSIIVKLRSGESYYILPDEILKGTNSKDQHTGSARLIDNIIRLNGFGMIATHDLELTNLRPSYGDRIKNIAFEIEMIDDKMSFDYKYKDGVCQNMNATILMEQMEIF